MNISHLTISHVNRHRVSTGLKRIPYEKGTSGLKITHHPLVEKNTVVILSLHIKLGLIKNFVKYLNNNCAACQQMYTLYLQLSVLPSSSRACSSDLRFDKCKGDRDKVFQELFIFNELRVSLP